MRPPNWPEILVREVERAASREFEWGAHDCALFAARVASAISESDFAEGFVKEDGTGRYKTPLGALRAIRRYGARDLTELATMKLGEPFSPLLAQRGDVVSQAVGDIDGFDVRLGICIGSHAVFASAKGLDRITLKECAQAWRVR